MFTCSFLCVLPHLVIYQHHNTFFFSFFSQDTIAIKKHSSRTRRIRPVSTRLSEYCCISSYPPLSPLSCLALTPSCLFQGSISVFSVESFFPFASLHLRSLLMAALIWPEPSLSQYISEHLLIVLNVTTLKRKWWLPVISPSCLLDCAFSVSCPHILYNLFIALHCHQVCVMTPAPLHPPLFHHTHHHYPARHPGRACQSCLHRACLSIMWHGFGQDLRGGTKEGTCLLRQ